MKPSTLTYVVMAYLCLLGSFVSLPAQYGNYQYGGDLIERFHAAAFVPWSGSTVLAGRFPTSTSTIGFVLEEKENPNGTFGFKGKFTVPGTNYQITAICANPNNQTFLTGGHATLPNGQVRAYFHSLDANGNLLGSWEIRSKDKLTISCITLASDGQYLIGGKSETYSPQLSFAFAAKMQFSPSIAVDWQHEFIAPGFSIGTLDQTVAITERTDGKFVIAGNTLISSTNTMPAPFVALLDNGGDLVDYRIYNVPGLASITAKDLVTVSDNSMFMTGTADNGSFGDDVFLLRIPSTLLGASYSQFVPVVGNTLAESGNSLIADEPNGRIYIAGSAVVSTPNNHSNGLILATNLFSTLVGEQTFGGSASDLFTDLIALPNGDLQALGVTYSFQSPGLLNENIYSVRIAPSLGGVCNEFHPSFKRTTAFGVGILKRLETEDISDITVGPILTRKSNLIMNAQVLCAGPLPRLAPEPEPQFTELTLFPNPASGSTILRIPNLEGEAQVQLLDLQGRILQSFAVGGDEVEIPLHGLPSGMYFVRLEVNGEIFSRRLVVEGF